MSTMTASCVAVFGKHPSKKHKPLWIGVAKLLLSHGYQVLVHEQSEHPSVDEKFHYANLDEIKQKASHAVIIGGDGTFLGIARELAGAGIPLIGINQGRLGFLTDIKLDDIDRSLIPTLEQGVLEPRYYLEGKICRQGEAVSKSIALNDIVISRGIVGGMVELRVSVDGRFMYDLRADGLILATPTGSTAYALSADGPILHPSVAGILIVPVAPHALTNRPIVLPPVSEITIEVTGGRQTAVHFDMQKSLRARIGDRIKIRVATNPVQLLHPVSYDYFSMLRQKLHWSASPTEIVHRTRGSRESSNAK